MSQKRERAEASLLAFIVPKRYNKWSKCSTGTDLSNLRNDHAEENTNDDDEDNSSSNYDANYAKHHD